MAASGKIIIVSNGHGEDAVGAALGRELAAAGLGVEALPLVGRGDAYEKAAMKVLGPRKAMPSGGLIHDDPWAVWRDLRAGLASATLAQWGGFWAAARGAAAALAVGDVYPLAVARLLSRGAVFQVQTLVSVRIWEPRPPFQPFGLPERLLMRGARRVYAREAESAAWLQGRGVRQAVCLGNPMLDAVFGEAGVEAPGPYLLLLPGSRLEARLSLGVMLEACRHLRRLPLTPAVAWAGPPLDGSEYPGWAARPTGQTSGAAMRLEHPDGTTVHLVRDGLKTLLAGAKLALSTSGTAAEQAAGYGVPLVGFPLPGTQYTEAFSRRQQRLLLGGLRLAVPEPGAIAREAMGLWDDPALYQRQRQAGLDAMGEPGAARRIARDLLEHLP